MKVAVMALFDVICTMHGLLPGGVSHPDQESNTEPESAVAVMVTESP
jgi:hypothetical protein